MSGGDVPGFDPVAEKEAVRRVLAEHAGGDDAHRMAYREIIRDVARQVAAERDALTPALEKLRASVIRRQAEILIETIDQRIERARIVKPVIDTGMFAKIVSRFHNLFGKPATLAPQHTEHRDLELAEHRHLQLQIAQRIFELVHVDLRVSGHLPDPIPFDGGADPIGDRNHAHRLCESQK